MRYGLCSWTLGSAPLGDTVARLAELGYDGLELPGDLAQYRAPEVRAALERHGLVLLSLTPENVDLAHPDAAVRRQAVDYYYRLLDFACGVGSPIVCCHGAVGRVRAVSGYEEEWRLFLEEVRRVGERAVECGLRLAMEVLNRYEAHLLNTAAQALRFVLQVGLDNVGVLLDAYHMNIEEADLRSAVGAAAGRLFLFHAADSNRAAVGRGHTDFLGLMRCLVGIGYDGAVILECTAPGPDPFTPVKGSGWQQEVWRYAAESIQLLRLYERLAAERG